MVFKQSNMIRFAYREDFGVSQVFSKDLLETYSVPSLF